MAAAEDDRSRREREFVEFRAETRAQLEQLREVYLRFAPIHEARSGEQAERAAMQRDIHEIKEDVAEVRKEVKLLTDAQRKWLAAFFALQVAAFAVMWLLNAGVIKLGGAP